MEYRKPFHPVKRCTKILLVIGSLFAFAVVGRARAETIPREILDRASIEGTIAVLVGLKVPWQMETALSETAILLQRRRIDSVQNELLRELSATGYKIVRRYETIPGIALEVGPEALAVLATSVNVNNVLADRSAIAPVNGRADRAGGNTVSYTGAVPQELFTLAATAGTVLVLVGLKAPWKPEGPLSETLIAVQRQAISAAQNYLLTELGNTNFTVTRRYQRIPGIALEVGEDALKILATSAAVTNVLQDRPAHSVK